MSAVRPFRDMSARLLPTHRRLAFGQTDRIRGLTPEAQSLKLYADRASAAWADIYRTHERRMGDEGQTPFARLKSSAEFARGKLKALDTHATDALARAEAELGILRRRLDAALTPTDAAQTILDAELRTHLRSLPPAEVLGAIRADPALRRAAATAPAALSGIAPDVHASLRSEHLQAVMPEEAAKYQDLVEAVDAAGTAMESLSKYSRELIDFESAEAA